MGLYHKKLLHSKGMMNKVTRQPMEREKTFVRHYMCDKRLTSKIPKEVILVNNSKINNPVKNGSKF